MRITKVKVKVKIGERSDMVLMKRNKEEGYLCFGKDGDKHNIQDILQSKQESFVLSLLNKTLIKEEVIKGENEKEIKNKKETLKALHQLFQNVLNNKSPKDEGFNLHIKDFKLDSEHGLAQFFQHKFIQKKTPEELELCGRITEYAPKQGADKINFNLIQELAAFLKDNPNAKLSDLKKSKIMQAYQAWARWWIGRKKELIERSIIKQKVYYLKEASSNTLHNVSKRQQVLYRLRNMLLTDSSPTWDDCLDSIKTKMDLNALCTEWLSYLKECKLKEVKDNNDNIIEYRLNASLWFQFKRNLKISLQKRQKSLFKEKLFCGDEGMLLEQYGLELSKYLAHYFPIKSSSRHIKFNWSSVNEYEDFLAQNISEYLLDCEKIHATIKNQLRNAVVQSLLKDGKALFHQKESCKNTKGLHLLKIREAFGLKFLDACAFAANSLRACVAPQETEDILGQTPLDRAFKNHQGNLEEKQNACARLAMFFPKFDVQEGHLSCQSQEHMDALNACQHDDYQKILQAIQASIARIRHQVVHYKEKALQDIFISPNLEKHFTNPPEWLMRVYEEEYKLLPHLMAETLKSSGILSFYRQDLIQEYCTQFQLRRKPMSFVPGFKTVFREAYKRRDFFGFKHYFTRQYRSLEDPLNEEEKDLSKREQAKYNLFKILYEQKFIAKFFEDLDFFKKTANDLREISQKNADKYKKHAWAFHDVPAFQENDTIKEYLANIQSMMMLEEQKNQDDRDQNTQEAAGHFQKFLWMLFAKGFDDFLKELRSDSRWHDDPKQGEICDRYFVPQQQEQAVFHAQTLNKQAHTLAEELHVSTSIAKDRDQPEFKAHLAFWIFCKMLDTKHLNDLCHQMDKWLQAQDGKKSDEDIKKYQGFQEIIEWVVLSVDRVTKASDTAYQEMISCVQKTYLAPNADIKTWTDVYTQSDEKTLIFLRGVDMSRKYATHSLLEKLMDQCPKHRVSNDDYKKWKKSKEDPKNSPEQLAERRQKLHAEWVDHHQEQKNKERKETWTKEEEYKSIIEQLDQFNWLDNKVHMVHIHRLHQLVIDILGRLAGFVNLFERDFVYFDRATSQRPEHRYIFNEYDNIYKFYCCNNNGILFKDKLTHTKGFDVLRKIYDKTLNCCLGKKHFVNKCDTDEIKCFIACIERKKILFEKIMGLTKEKTETRKYLAHFNYLTTGAEYSILDLIAQTRDLVAYDRKLKNAVAKSIIDILDKHGIDIKFADLHNDHHAFKIQHCKPKKIKHLKGAVLVDQVHEKFVAMVKDLLTYKKNNCKDMHDAPSSVSRNSQEAECTA